MKKVILFLSFVFSSLYMFAQDAPELVCATPSLYAYPLEATTAKVIWNSTAAPSYTIQYRLCSDSLWTTVNNVSAGTGTRDTGTYTLRSLVACKCYIVRIRANCSANEVSDWRSYEFHTIGCVEPCRAPSQLFAAARDSMAVLNWSSMGTGRTYLVQWKSRADLVWQNQTSSTNSLTINHLQPCSEYQFRVKTFCSATDTSTFSEIVKFKTSGCVAPCSTPREVRVVSVDRTTLLLSWVTTGARAYEVMYSVGDSAPHKATVTINAFRIPNVSTCKIYKFQVRSICGTAAAPLYSEWSTNVSIITEGCIRCNAPTRLSFTTTETGALLKWDTLQGSTFSYEIQWMGPRDTAWHTVSGVHGNQYALTGLTACTWYMFRVKTNCNSTAGSYWSAPIRFQTKGCPPVCAAPRNISVHVSDTTAVISWIGVTSVSTYRLIITSSDNTFTREINVTGSTYILTGLARCKTYKVQVKTICSATLSSEAVIVTFETRGCSTLCGVPREIGFQTDSNKVTVKWANMGASKYYIEYKLASDSLGAWKRDSSTTNSLVLTNLQSCKTYLIRIASVCPNGVSAFTNFAFATTGCPAPCVPPVEFSSEIVTDTAASVKFNIVTGQSYTVQYRLAGTANWTSIQLNAITPNNLPVRITGLLKCTTYQWRVLRACSTGSLVESALQSFTTKGCPTPCTAVPRDLVVTGYSADSAKLTWIMPTAGLIYEVRFGGATDSSIFSATPIRLTTNVFVMHGLVTCRHYIVQVRTICPNGLASEWVTKQFRIGANCQSIEPSSNEPLVKVQYISDFGVYPNPGSESVQVSYTLEKDAEIKIELMNLQGQIVNRFDGGNQEVGNYAQTLSNLSAMQTGIYLVVIRVNGKVEHTQKWQKQ